ncbi:hypothetical protein A1O3_06476 [Capronia epimyces CBS 606.96]|uniref:DNL-type domain-containing protein n=1 Tax=Capronia epimyces CBS 606.96 TaxID=1182542 RepID=W9XQ34_9EURO|nr:uncharacterized protein A1O3_06476 [Capronia epimyces CBS 606.96]EXJ82662.1 hypothetical protein A1O3_06476 [Capronia epimyces CBS 606.96]
MQSLSPRLISHRSLTATLRRQVRLHSSLSRTPFAARCHHSPRPSFTPFRRYESSLTVPETTPRKPVSEDQPSYQLSFTCKPCLYRSSHRVTKHGYHHGTVLITCPSCKARHVIADHLKVFLDSRQTLEDILREKAEKGEDFTKLLKKGQLGIRPGSVVGNEGEEDIEFWEDGTETVHTPLDGGKASPQGSDAS